MVGGRCLGWDVWRELRSHPEIVLKRGILPDAVGGAVYWPQGDLAAVVLDKRLSRVERRAALAHELVHHERGGGTATWDGMPAAMTVIEDRDEARVNDEVARRLVPLEELAKVIKSATSMELPIETWQIAAIFDVPDRVADRAMQLLKAGAWHE